MRIDATGVEEFSYGVGEYCQSQRTAEQRAWRVTWRADHVTRDVTAQATRYYNTPQYLRNVIIILQQYFPWILSNRSHTIFFLSWTQYNTVVVKKGVFESKIKPHLYTISFRFFFHNNFASGSQSFAQHFGIFTEILT